jgi:hypothetical protein
MESKTRILGTSLFGGRVVISSWYAWGAAAQVRRCDVGRYVKYDRLRGPRSFPNAVLEDTRDIYTQDVQLIERRGMPNKTNHFERLGESASHGSL